MGLGQLEAATDISAMVYMESNNLMQSLAAMLKGKEQRSQADKSEEEQSDGAKQKGALSK